MSQNAFFDTTEALRARIGQALGNPKQVHVGPPLSSEVGQRPASLFLFHLMVNAELRNERRRAAPPALEPAQGPAPLVESIAWDLLYLISVFRTPDGSVEPPNELRTLGQIVQILHAQPALTNVGGSGQIVRVSPVPYPMEEVSRIWGLFPQDGYRTSVVYLATPVVVSAEPIVEGRVVRRESNTGALP